MNTLRWLAGLLFVAGSLAAPLHAAQENELKDESGKTILKYVIEVPPGLAPAGTTDPTRQAGLILCSQEHDTPTGNDLFPVRQSLLRQGLLDRFVLIAPAPQGRKFGPDDHQPIEKLIAWARRTYPINPRRVYMYGKGEGSKISMEFTMTHPNLVTAAIGYSWGAWLMPSEVKEPLDFVNSAPELYLTLGRRDLANHLSCVRDAYQRLQAKGYHFIYREFDELGDRTYHPPSNDDSLAWATRLRNKDRALLGRSDAAQGFQRHPAGSVGRLLSFVGARRRICGGHCAAEAVSIQGRERSRCSRGDLRSRHFRRGHRRCVGRSGSGSVNTGAPGRDPRACHVWRLALRNGSEGTDPGRHR